jgi:hypothetical protein
MQAGREEMSADRAEMEETGVEESVPNTTGRAAIGGLAGWLLARFRRAPRTRPHLALLERIALAPRQSLVLVEAEGRRLLVATSADCGPVFYPLDRYPLDETFDASRRAAAASPALRTARRPAARSSSVRRSRAAKPSPRVSW